MSIAQKVLADPGKYSIQQLQQAMQSGVIPAYIAIPIIQSKIQEQKQAQVAQTMQQPPAQQKPPVAQQVMDEARGLEALPTNLPTQMAAGGIVAFDDGGEVKRYQYGGVTRWEDLKPYIGAEGVDPNRVRAEMQQFYGISGGHAAFPRVRPTQLRGDVRIDPVTGKPITYAEFLTRQSTPSGDPTAGFGGMPSASDAPSVGRDSAPAPAPASASATLGGGISQLAKGLGLDLTKSPMERISGRGSISIPTVTGGDVQPFVPPSGKSMTAQTMELLGGYEGASGYLERAAARDQAADAAIAEANKGIKGQAFDEYKKTLESEAKRLGADKDEAKHMSLFKAGLAMMAGTSRHGLENIGKGAMVGAEDYQAAMKDIRKADKENRKELALIEQARRAEALGDRDKALARIEQSRDRGDLRDRYVGDALQKALGVDRAQAYDMAKTNFTTQADIYRTNLTGLYGLAGQQVAGEYGLAGKELAGQYGLAGQDVGGRYSLLAAALTAAGKDKLTPYQESRLRLEAEKQVDPIAVRNELAKSLGLSKVPAPGADKTFDQKVNQLFEQKVYERIYGAPPSATGATGTDPFAGFKLVP